jgi:hypothetical protein
MKTGPRCPKCGSGDVAGLVAAFWVSLNEDGEPEIPLHKSVESNTELTAQRQCTHCEHEWEG